MLFLHRLVSDWVAKTIGLIYQHGSARWFSAADATFLIYADKFHVDAFGGRFCFYQIQD